MNEQSTWGDLLTLLSEKQGLLRKYCDQIWAQEHTVKLSASEWSLLSRVSGRQATVSETARMLGISRQGVHKYMGSLMEKGLLQVVQRPENKRDKYVVLTPLGEECHRDYRRLTIAFEKKVAFAIGEDNLRTLKALLRQNWLEPAASLSYTIE